jgi:hypothetical protein
MMSDEADRDLIDHYRAFANGTPGAAIDRAILDAARAVSWRRRHAWTFALAAAAACVVLAAGLDLPERMAVMPPRQEAETATNGLQEWRARAFLLDARAMRDSALAQQPGATARPHTSSLSRPEDQP